MATLIFDIETVGEDYEKMDSASQAVLTKWIKENSDSDEEYAHQLELLVKRLGFSPYTAEVVSIALLDYEKDKGKVYFQGGTKTKPFTEDKYDFEVLSEPEMLKRFWQGAENYSDVVTFNGRGFDVPFLMVRSAIHKIRPSANLMADRYIERQKFGVRHIDLQDQLNFYGAIYKRGGGLHMITRAFGITSPKQEGVSGEDVGMLYAGGNFEDIARYNARDVDATAALYSYWDEYLRF